MKRKILATLLTFLLYILLPKKVLAQTAVFNLCDPARLGAFAPLCALTALNLPNLVSAVIEILLIVAVIISLIFLIIGGIRWITSGGDKAAVQAARSQIIAAIVGLIIALLAFFILTFVLRLFGITSQTFVFPNLTGL